ncbi:N6-adenosine-methyltransferase subunit mettl14, partial [Nowakowskiella sp. JEL0407]
MDDQLGPLLQSHSQISKTLRSRQKYFRRNVYKHVNTNFDSCSLSFIDQDTLSGNQPKSEKLDKIIRNDYMQNFINSSSRPQNFIRDTSVIDRFEEYPKLRQLSQLKDSQSEQFATPPMYLNADLFNFKLSSLQSQFDVILIDPPLPEYAPRSGGLYWTWDDIANLKIEEIAAVPSFIFLWIGNEEGLERGREILAKWKYRRCEDIVWIKTNKTWKGKNETGEDHVLIPNKEHCLMGIKGTVRRSTDGHFIHCNVDTDVIIAEEPMFGSLQKPEELYYIIERFCLGRRRLELFGEDHNVRPGWVTIGQSITSSNFNVEKYKSFFADGSGTLVPSTP